MIHLFASPDLCSQHQQLVDADASLSDALWVSSFLILLSMLVPLWITAL